MPLGMITSKFLETGMRDTLNDSRCLFCMLKWNRNIIKGGKILEKLRKQSTFYQKVADQAKLGAYYTDQEHCRSIAEFLQFPLNEEVCVLEPAIGNAEAVRTITGSNENKNIHIFGVELNQETAESVLGSAGIEECIWGDFLTEVLIGQGNFSFCFGNPPYGEEETDSKRLEIRFLKKIIPCLSEEAVLVYVIPIYVATTDRFLEEWCGTFETDSLYRFREKEFEKWKQIVIFGRKRKKEKKVNKRALKEWVLNPEKLEILPEHYYGKKIQVNASNRKDVSEFAAKHFNEERIRKGLVDSALDRLVQEKITPEPFITDQLKRPPIMPNQGQLYLMAVAGAGQGVVGTLENQDIHLQRGIVKNVEEENIYEENGKQFLSVQRYTKINFNIIENDGKRHQF